MTIRHPYVAVQTAPRKAWWRQGIPAHRASKAAFGAMLAETVAGGGGGGGTRPQWETSRVAPEAAASANVLKSGHTSQKDKGRAGS